MNYLYNNSLSPHFSTHFPYGPRLAVTRTSPFWNFPQLRMMEVMSGDN